MDVFVDPQPSPWDDLPEGVAVLMAASRESSALELVEVALLRARQAQAYADHVACLALSLGTVTYADVARPADMTRQGARKRYAPSVEHLRLEQDQAAADLPGMGWKS